MNDLMRTAITSMEAAEWCGKEHSKLLRDIRNYISQLGEAKIGFSDFSRNLHMLQSKIRHSHAFSLQRRAVSLSPTR